jgi:hypothetical protein
MTFLRVRSSRPLLPALLLAAVSPVSLAYPFQPVFERATVIGPVLRDAIVAADFDGDGIDEIVTATSSPTQTIIAYSNAGVPLEQRQVISLSRVQSANTQLHVWPSPQGPRLVSVTAPNWSSEPTVVSVYAGWPLSRISTHTLPIAPRDSRVGDVAVDGSPELISVYNSEVRATSLGSGDFLWSIPVGGSSIALHNLDADPALEIIIAGPEGYVYDGLTRQQEWRYPDGFGSLVAAGNVGPNGSPGFVGARDSDLFTVFRTAPWSPIWDQLQYRTNSLRIANLDGTGADEIMTSESSWGNIRIFDSQTRALRREILTSNSGSGGFATPRIRSGVQRHIVQATSNLYSFSDALTLVDPSTGATVRSLASDASGVTTTSMGDFNADGRVELLMSSGDGWGSRIRIANLETGADEWLSPPSNGGNEPLNMQPKRFLSAQLDTDAAREIVIAGDSFYSGRIVVMDGASRAIQLQIGDSSNLRPLDARSITDALLMDFDGDGHLDVVVSTEPSTSGESGVRLHAFSLRTGALLWESVRIGASYNTSRGVFLLNNGGQGQLVAVLTTGLRGFGVQSQLLEWTYSGNIDKALLFTHAPGSAEIVMEDAAGRVTHLDAATREVRRAYNLPERSAALVAVPAAPYLVAAFADTLTLLRLDGSLVGTTEGVRVNLSAAPLAVGASDATTHVMVGTQHGFRLFELNPDGVFKDGFDPR